MRDFAERLIAYETRDNKSSVVVSQLLRNWASCWMNDCVSNSLTPPIALRTTVRKESTTTILGLAASIGLNLTTPQKEGKLEILYLRPLDLSVDETMQEILDAVARIGAKRVVIDSLVGFEMALAPGFREDFRESLYRMIGALTGAGITILSTVEVEDTFTALPFSQYTISFLTDDIIRMRYVEIAGQLRKVMVIIKMRGGNHSKDIREYIITDKGVVVIGPRQTEYAGLTTGSPERISQPDEAAPEPKATK